jgi:TetR/AcrR family transcriptional regulator, regulator of cefoperazone and chloramphenicol sensitivity
MTAGEPVADSTRRRIVAAAGEIFAEQGFEATTVREICQNARTNVASVNYHFGDKRRLYEVCLEEARCHRDALFPMPSIDAGLPLMVRLVKFLEGVVARFLVSDPSGWEGRLMLRELLQPSAVGRPLLEQTVRPQFDYLAKLIEELAPTAEPSERNYVCYYVVGQCILFRTAGPLLDFLTPNFGPFSGTEKIEVQIRELAIRIARGSCALLGAACTVPIDGSQFSELQNSESPSSGSCKFEDNLRPALEALRSK